MASPKHPSSLTTIFLDQPPSCLQFCPATPQNFIIGTYLLSESLSSTDSSTITQKKTGSLQLWHLDPATTKLTQIHHLPTPHAVFDLHFHPTNPTLFATATSAGEIALFTVSPTQITPLWTKPVHEESPSIPALYFAWIPADWLPHQYNSRDGFAVTFADGRTTIFASSTDSLAQACGDRIKAIDSFEARQRIEVWFVALLGLPLSGQDVAPYMFTGDDFGSLRVRRFDHHSHTEEETLEVVLDVDDRGRHHTAGVTAILPLPVSEEEGPWLLTGSYDEVLRVYHASGRGRVVAEMGLGGGVWRLRVVDTLRTGERWVFLVLASCMHAGTRVVEVNLDRGEAQGAEIRVLAEFTEHESMNYASDVWKPEGWSEGRREGALCVSSSFYDRRVCVWGMDL